MVRSVAACLLLGALFCCASAARMSTMDRLERMGGSAQTIQWLQQRLARRSSEEKGGEQGAIIVTKYDVPPSMHSDFIDAWNKVQDETMKEEGAGIYELKKTMGDNVYFWTYGEWNTMDQFMDHFTSDYVEDFKDFLDERDIMWHMYPLDNITDNAAMRKESYNRKGKGKGDDPRDMMAHVVIEYHVPPSKVDDFIDAWKDCASSTWEEKDNYIYALRRVSSMNHHFVAYGSWKTYDAYMDHFMAKHTRKLREILADRDIIWFTDPLMSMGDTSGGRKQ